MGHVYSTKGPQQTAVHRTAITLKLLDHFENGAMVAASTSSLPEAIGGNAQLGLPVYLVRDADFSVYALRRVEMGEISRSDHDQASQDQRGKVE